MRKNILILYCCLIACLFSTCQKDEADLAVFPSGEEPVFFIEGTIGIENLNLVAGDDGFFMFTSYEVSDSSSQLKGELAHELGCDSDCRSLSITLHNYIPDNTIEATGIGDSITNLPVSPPPFPSTEEIEYTFIADEPEDNITTHRWDFFTLDGTLLSSADGTSATLQQASSMIFRAKLTSTAAYGCSASTERRIDFEVDPAPPCNCDIIVSPDSVNFYPVLYTDCPAEYIWNDSVYEDSISTSLGGEENCLELNDQDGLYCMSCVQSYLLPDQQIPDICNTNFSYKAAPLIPVQNEEIPYASIVYRNADNTIFSSDLTIQPDDAFLKILNTQPYERNANDQATQLLTIDLSATLKATNSNTTYPIQIQGSFGVALPD